MCKKQGKQNTVVTADGNSEMTRASLVAKTTATNVTAKILASLIILYRAPNIILIHNKKQVVVRFLQRCALHSEPG